MVTPKYGGKDQKDCVELENTRGRTTEVFVDLVTAREKPNEFTGTRVA